jgi:hypothetical protein
MANGKVISGQGSSSPRVTTESLNDYEVVPTKAQLCGKAIFTTPSAFASIMATFDSKLVQRDVAMEAVRLAYESRDYDKQELLIGLIAKFSEEITTALVLSNTYFIKYVPPLCQTLKMCDAAVKLMYKNDKANMCSDFSHVAKQTEESAKLAVSGDARCYKYLKEEFQTEEMRLLAVNNDGCSLASMKGYHSEAVATAAVKQWAKAVRYVNCEDAVVQEKLYLMAIEANLQAMPSPKETRLTEKVIARFKELSIEGNYFDEDWAATLGFTQERLYTMLELRKQWIEAHLIFRLLDGKHMLKALKADLLERRIELKESEIVRLHVMDSELVSLLLEKADPKSSRAYFLSLWKSGNSPKMEALLVFNGILLQYIPEGVQTEEMCITAVENNKSAIEYVKVWTPRTLKLLLA